MKTTDEPALRRVLHVRQQQAALLERPGLAGGAPERDRAVHPAQAARRRDDVVVDVLRPSVRRCSLPERGLWITSYATHSTAYGCFSRTPIFASVAILSLALGIGANAAIFQLIDTVRFRSLPVADPQGLAEVHADGVNGFGISADFNSEATYPLWEQIREHQTAFASMFAWGDAQFLVGRAGEARPARGLWVSGDFFRSLGITPERGRLFTADDDRRGCGAGAAVVSDAFWRSHLGGREAAIGSVLTVLDQPFTVVGVTPAGFTGLEVGQSFDIALPLCSATLWGDSLDRRDLWWLTVMGRLKPDWNLRRADAHLRALSPGLLDTTLPSGYGAELTARYRAFRFGVLPAGRGVSRLRGPYGASLSLLFSLTGLVLLMTCANLATLTLARASAREREIAVRVAIGASRPRVVSQMLIESVLVAIGGAALAVVVALVSGRALVAFLDTSANPVALNLSADWRLISFVGAVAVLTVVLFGLIPALRVSFVDPIVAMRQSSRGLTVDRHRARFQRGLVAGQIAVSLVLVVSALLFVRSFRNLARVNTGFEQDGTIAVTFLDRQAESLSVEQRLAFQQRLTDEIRSVPGVAAAASSTQILLSGASWFHFFRIPGLAGNEQQASRFTYVSPGYFETLKIPILSGRDFELVDNRGSRRVALVNESFVRHYLGERRRSASRFAPLQKRVIRRRPTRSSAWSEHEVLGPARRHAANCVRADRTESQPPALVARDRAFTPALDSNHCRHRRAGEDAESCHRR